MGDRSDWLVCQQVQTALAQFEPSLREAIATEDSQILEMALHLINRRGKRLRPAILLTSAHFGNFDQSQLLKAAAAMELLHIASLYHDDIMDRAPARRGGVSANVRWGNTLAALVGTYLFARASIILASLGDTPNQLASHASANLCIGQMREMENAFNLELTEAEHLDILACKTATLFELPCRLGAYLSGVSSEYAAALTVYGHHLGLAFQLSDDALDLMGQASQLGKVTGTDIREGIYTLPILRTLQKGGTVGEQLRSLLGQERLKAEEVKIVLELVQKSGGDTEALEVAQEYVRRAKEALEVLPDDSARRSLYNLVDYVTTRSS